MTILPKKKTGKEKPAGEQASHDGTAHTSHHHGASHHTIPEGRVRLETAPVRNPTIASASLEDRHRSSRLRLSSEYVAPVDSSSSSSSHGSSYETAESGASCISGDTGTGHPRGKPPSPEMLDAVSVKSGNLQQLPCDAVNTVADMQSHVVKRRHGRMSPHSQPYARSKTTRNSAPLSDSNASCSTAPAVPYHHNSSRRHHSREERKPASPPVPLNNNVPSRTSRRRQRPRSDGKEDRDGNNSDDEHDANRLQQLNQGIDFEELEVNFARALKEDRGFLIKEMTEDGACLFRAVAEQVYGDQNMHDEVRKNCMDYMMKNSDFFSNYVTEDFVSYVRRKRLPHTYGNHLEMQAMAEMYNRSFEVYQYSTEPINTFQSSILTDNDPIRVSYHRNSHYNAVIDPYKASVGVGLGLPSFRPGLADQMLLENAQRASEEALLEEQMLQDKLRAADWENTEDEMLREVAQESFAEYLRHQKETAKSNKPAGTADAGSKEPTCSKEPPEPRKQPPIHDASKQETASTSQATYTSACIGNPGLGDWVDENDESTILAQVMAQSQREYYDTLTRHKDDSSSATCSKYATYQ